MSKKINPIPQKIRFAALAVDVVCFRVKDGELEVLVGKINTTHHVYDGWWAHIGGLVRVKETTEQAVNRLLTDKAGISDIYKEQLYTFSAIDRDPRGRVVSVAYIALTNTTNIQDITRAQIETVWRPVSRLPKLAYDHSEIIQFAIDRLRTKIIYTDIARHLMPEEFTLSELQRTYEAVIGKGMDKRNFRKRIMTIGVLKDTKRTMKKGVMRPAMLYRFK